MIEDNLIIFNDRFVDIFIANKAKQYNIPVNFCDDIVIYCHMLGIDIMTIKGRELTSDIISEMSCEYHEVEKI